MSSWKDRKKKIKAVIDYDPLITIPMMEGSDVSLTAMQERIRGEFDRKKCENITIIDQYFLPTDIEFIIHTFASLRGRKLRIITKLADPENRGQTEKHEENFKDAIKEIERKKIFSEFRVYKTNRPIHDRYFISEDIDANSPCFSLGTSVNMLFDKYSCLLKIENNSFKRQVKKLANICLQDCYEIRDSDGE